MFDSGVSTGGSTDVTRDDWVIAPRSHPGLRFKTREPTRSPYSADYRESRDPSWGFVGSLDRWAIWEFRVLTSISPLTSASITD
jgi:hypothetical protein